MTIPEDFSDRFERRFDGRFRIRWSDVEERFLIEQRIRRGIAEGVMPPGDYRNKRQRKVHYEDSVRAQQGYMLTGVVTAGTTAYCSRCDSPSPSIPMKFTVTACKVCASKGIEQPVQAGFFLLNDQLIAEIEKADPLRGGIDRVSAGVKQDNAQLEIEQEADFIRPVDAAARDRYRRLLGIPMTGSTRVFAGSAGPGTR